VRLDRTALLNTARARNVAQPIPRAGWGCVRADAMLTGDFYLANIVTSSDANVRLTGVENGAVVAGKVVAIRPALIVIGTDGLRCGREITLFGATGHEKADSSSVVLNWRFNNPAALEYGSGWRMGLWRLLRTLLHLVLSLAASLHGSAPTFPCLYALPTLVLSLWRDHPSHQSLQTIPSTHAAQLVIR
jgi:hypothetical protein